MSGAITAMAVIGTVGSMGMNIMGSAQQSQAQRAAGETAYQNALARNQMLEAQAQEQENEAKQREAQAKAEQAAAQRAGIEQTRKSNAIAGRASAVMAASGGGVDTNILAGILGEGDYAKDVALYEGDDRASKLNYQGKINRYQADVSRYEGKQGVARGQYTRDVMNSRADATLAMGIGKTIFQGMSLAGKYGGDLPGTGATASSPDDAMAAYAKAPNSWKYAGLESDVGEIY